MYPETRHEALRKSCLKANLNNTWIFQTIFLALKTMAGVFSKAAEKGGFLKTSWLQEKIKA